MKKGEGTIVAALAAFLLSGPAAAFDLDLEDRKVRERTKLWTVRNMAIAEVGYVRIRTLDTLSNRFADSYMLSRQ